MASRSSSSMFLCMMVRLTQGFSFSVMMLEVKGMFSSISKAYSRLVL